MTSTKKTKKLRALNVDDLSALHAQAYNTAARRIAHEGVRMTHNQADMIGATCLDWARKRLDVVVLTTDEGVELRPHPGRAR